MKGVSNNNAQNNKQIKGNKKDFKKTSSGSSYKQKRYSHGKNESRN